MCLKKSWKLQRKKVKIQFQFLRKGIKKNKQTPRVLSCFFLWDIEKWEVTSHPHILLFPCGHGPAAQVAMSRGGGWGRAGGLPHWMLCMTWRSRGSKQRFPSRPRLGQAGQESRTEGPLPVKEDALWRAGWTQWRERRCGSWDILQRSACQEGWQCPTPEGCTSQRMPAWTMPDPLRVRYLS